MKWGMARLPHFTHWSQIAAQPFAHGAALLVVCSGLTAYLLSMICWIRVLSYIPLNRAYPVIGMSYGLVYLGGVMLPWYHEVYSFQGIAGVLLIAAGVV